MFLITCYCSSYIADFGLKPWKILSGLSLNFYHRFNRNFEGIKKMFLIPNGVQHVFMNGRLMANVSSSYIQHCATTVDTVNHSIFSTSFSTISLLASSSPFYWIVDHLPHYNRCCLRN